VHPSRMHQPIGLRVVIPSFAAGDGVAPFPSQANARLAKPPNRDDTRAGLFQA
jgi:hypothetical protein